MIFISSGMVASMPIIASLVTFWSAVCRKFISFLIQRDGRILIFCTEYRFLYPMPKVLLGPYFVGCCWIGIIGSSLPTSGIDYCCVSM